jgi:hypothetical protein
VTNAVATYWVKIVRTGNVFTGYCSPDSGNWAPIATNTISMPTDVVMGLAVTSKANGTLNTSIFKYVSVTGDPLYDFGL